MCEFLSELFCASSESKIMTTEKRAEMVGAVLEHIERGDVKAAGKALAAYVLRETDVITVNPEIPPHLACKLIEVIQEWGEQKQHVTEMLATAIATMHPDMRTEKFAAFLRLARAFLDHLHEYGRPPSPNALWTKGDSEWRRSVGSALNALGRIGTVSDDVDSMIRSYIGKFQSEAGVLKRLCEGAVDLHPYTRAANRPAGSLARNIYQSRNWTAC